MSFLWCPISAQATIAADASHLNRNGLISLSDKTLSLRWYPTRRSIARSSLQAPRLDIRSQYRRIGERLCGPRPLGTVRHDGFEQFITAIEESKMPGREGKVIAKQRHCALPRRNRLVLCVMAVVAHRLIFELDRAPEDLVDIAVQLRAG